MSPIISSTLNFSNQVQILCLGKNGSLVQIFFKLNWYTAFQLSKRIFVCFSKIQTKQSWLKHKCVTSKKNNLVREKNMTSRLNVKTLSFHSFSIIVAFLFWKIQESCCRCFDYPFYFNFSFVFWLSVCNSAVELYLFVCLFILRTSYFQPYLSWVTVIILCGLFLNFGCNTRIGITTTSPTRAAAKTLMVMDSHMISSVLRSLLSGCKALFGSSWLVTFDMNMGTHWL